MNDAIISAGALLS